MNAHLCPSCSALIESDSALFCYNCGQELSGNDAGTRTTPPPKAKEIAKRSGSKPRIGLVLLFVLLVLTGFLALNLILKARDQRPLSTVSPTQEAAVARNEFISTSSALPLAPFDFSGVDFASRVPSEVLYYIQSRSPSLLLNKLLSQDQREEFVKKTGLSFAEALSFLGDDYAFARAAEGSLFLSQIKDMDFAESKLSEFNKETLHGELIDDILFISDSRELLKKVAAVSGKSQLSLSQVSRFFDGRRRLPKMGQALLYTRESGELAEATRAFFGKDIFGGQPANLRGNVFVAESVLGNVKIVGTDE